MQTLSAPNPIAEPPRRTWVVSPAFDLTFFWGASALGLLTACIMLIWPQTVTACTWVWLVGLEGPHLIATWQRVYLDREERQTWRWLMPWSALTLSLGGVIWFLSTVFQSPLLFNLMLGLAALVAWDHAVRQHWGVYSLYAARNRIPEFWRRFDHIFLHVFLWFLLVNSLTVSPGNIHDYLSWLEPAYLRYLQVFFTAFTVIMLCAYAFSLLLRARRKVAPAPGIFALLCVFGLLVFIIYGIGPHEPLFSQASNPEQRILAMTAAGGFIHSWQYLGVVFAANKGRVKLLETGEQQPGTFSLQKISRILCRSPLFYYVLLVLISVLYGVLNGARGTMPGFNLFDANSGTARLFQGLYWGLFFHHFLLDHYIWRVRSQPRLRAEFGFA